jgi:ACS family tartrate transporter-like MFS transporter
LLLGAPVSGLLLGANWLGLAGWRWVFIVEGLPAFLLGFVTLAYLVDRPGQAKWLRPEERDLLEKELAAEKAAKAREVKQTAWVGLRDARAWLLAFGLLFANIGVVGFILWLPTTIQQSSGLPPGWSAALAAVPFFSGMVGVLLCSRSSDRTGERLFHTTFPMLGCGLLFAVTAFPGQPFALKLLMLSVSGGAIFAWAPSFWVLPTLALGESAAAAAIGFINSVGNLGGFVGPFVVGRLLTGNRPFSVAVLFLSACFGTGALLTFLGGRRSHIHRVLNGAARPLPLPAVGTERE